MKTQNHRVREVQNEEDMIVSFDLNLQSHQMNNHNDTCNAAD